MAIPDFPEKDTENRQLERQSIGFSLTRDQKERYLAMSRSARSSDRVKAREASTRYLRWLSVPRSPAELAKYPVPTTVAELRNIQEDFR